MKAKILGFFCSLLIVNFAYGQTIDGRLYTQFNNYYKWRGGAFDSTLLLPQDSAKSGLRPGAVRYNIADSTVYSWSGTQWRKVGSGEIPTLQQVTTAGNTTTSNIKFTNDTSGINFNDNIKIYTDESRVLHLYDIGSEIDAGIDFSQVIDGGGVVQLPDSIGTLTQRVAINGLTYNTAANGVVNLGNTDTATVVKAYVTNAEAVTITKGQVVYIFGASGDRAAVKLAKNTSDTFSSKTLGIVRADIAAGQAGWVTTQGQVSGINLGSYSPGDILWLDSVPGGFTKVKPVSPLHSVFVGVVERANPGNGLIYVKPQNGVELSEVHDVLITSPTNNQVLSYTASTGIWENKSVTTALGYTPVKINIRDTIASQKWWVKDSLPITTARRWALVVDTLTNRIERQNLNIFRRDQDTVPLAVFNVGSAAAGDTAAFSTSTLAGSFYLDGTDTMFVTSYRVALQGTSASITPEVWFNDSLNVTAGGTRLATGSAITNLTTGTSVTPTTNKIPPGNFVFVRFSAVTTKPTYFTLTLFGYRIRKQ